MSGTTKVQLCGRLSAVIEGRDITDRFEDRPAREMFAYLVVHRLQPMSRDDIRATFSALDDERFTAALGALQAALVPHLEGAIDLQLRLPVGSVVDLEAAGEAVHRAEATVARQDWTQAWPAARVALHIARRTFLPGSEAPWIGKYREKLRQIEIRAHECVAATGLGMGGTEILAAHRSGRALIDLEPTRESGYRFAMEAAAREGNTADAVKLYDELRSRLRSEIGIEPGTATREVLSRISTDRVVNQAGSERVSTAASEIERTFMFTDIVSSTVLLSAVGDQAWQRLVDWHDRTLRACFAAHGGEEIDHAGDGFFVAFSAGSEAVRCAISVQRQLEEHRHAHGFAPQVRIGLHTAEALRHDGKYVGRGVHEAARIGGLAHGGQIVASVRTIAGMTIPATSQRPAVLKGIDETIDVVTVGWEDST